LGGSHRQKIKWHPGHFGSPAPKKRSANLERPQPAESRGIVVRPDDGSPFASKFPCFKYLAATLEGRGRSRAAGFEFRGAGGAKSSSYSAVGFAIRDLWPGFAPEPYHFCTELDRSFVPFLGLSLRASRGAIQVQGDAKLLQINNLRWHSALLRLEQPIGRGHSTRRDLAPRLFQIKKILKIVTKKEN
jgi:hypothetical protein